MRLYTDIDPFCCEVLRARVADGGLPPGEVWQRDIKTITAEELRPFRQVHLFAGIGGSPLGLKWAGWPDDRSIVTGGFPCQNISSAGKKEGIEGEQSALWKEMLRIIKGWFTIRRAEPCYFIVENSAGLLARGLGTVLADLAAIGCDAEWDGLSSAAVGANHRRDRVWICGNSHGDGESNRAEHDEAPWLSQNGSNAEHLGRTRRVGELVAGHEASCDPATPMGVDDGLPNRMDRLRALGNSQDPRAVKVIARAMMQTERSTP